MVEQPSRQFQSASRSASGTKLSRCACPHLWWELLLDGGRLWFHGRRPAQLTLIAGRPCTAWTSQRPSGSKSGDEAVGLAYRSRVEAAGGVIDRISRRTNLRRQTTQSRVFSLYLWSSAAPIGCDNSR